MEIYPIRDPEDISGLAWFSQVAAEIYRGDPVWAPQSEGYFQQTLAAAQVSGTRVIPLVGLQDGRPLARAAAILNPSAPALGYIGFLEHLPEAQAAGRQMLEACENLLRAWGAAAVQAPRVDNLWMGLQVKGFDLPQTLFTPHNPPEYEHTLLSCGYREVERLCTYRFTRASVRIPVLNLSGVRTRTFNRQRLESEVRLWNELQSQIFKEHAGYVPRRLEEDRAMIQAFLPMLDDDLVIIAENDDHQAVGLLVCLPDMYSQKSSRQNRPTPDPSPNRGNSPSGARSAGEKEDTGEIFGTMYRKSPQTSDFLPPPLRAHQGCPLGTPLVRPKGRGAGGMGSSSQLKCSQDEMNPFTSARLISIGVLPGWKYKGSGALMVNHLVRSLLAKGYQSLEASWIKADNRLPHNLALRFGGEPGREFAVFEKKL